MDKVAAYVVDIDEKGVSCRFSCKPMTKPVFIKKLSELVFVGVSRRLIQEVGENLPYYDGLDVTAIMCRFSDGGPDFCLWANQHITNVEEVKRILGIAAFTSDFFQDTPGALCGTFGTPPAA